MQSNFMLGNKMQPQNDLRYFDLATGDLGKARSFYGGLLSWEFRELTPEDPQAGVFFHTGGGQGGGMYLDARPGAAGGWTPYFQVDDLAAMVARAQRLGGEIVVAPMATPGGLGALCIIRDPCGATVGLWQAQTVDGSAASGRHRRPAANTGGGRLRGLTVSFPKSNSNQKEDSHGTGT